MVSNHPSKLDVGELQQAAPRPVTAEERLLAAAVLTAPISWALHLVLSYGLSYPAVRWQSKAVLFAVSLVGAMASLVSVWLGRRCLSRATSVATTPGQARERSRFLGTAACLAGAFFLVVIVAQTVPTLLLPLGGE
jgi:hypothetical protein